MNTRESWWLEKTLRLTNEPHLFWGVLRRIVRILRLGSFGQRVRFGAPVRPAYAYCVYEAACLAKRLNTPRISVIEFGVAQGVGLLALERHAQDAERETGVAIEVYGFDTGVGLGQPEGYRDLPYHWRGGFYAMDVPRLRAKLTRAQLILGDVRETLPSFTDAAPVGAILFDLDYYSSTVAALELFDAPSERFLPRVFCYFDDVLGGEIELYNEFTGVRLAINEFNTAHPQIKIGAAHYLLARPLSLRWYHQIGIAHLFEHPRYNDFVSNPTPADVTALRTETSVAHRDRHGAPQK